MAESDKLYNVTEITTEITTTTDVDVALKEFGISKKVAKGLAANHSEDYLLGKLDQVRWLVETGSSLVGKNPAGYLRKAIEEDYLPPPQYTSSAERAREEENRRRADNCIQCQGTGFYQIKENNRVLAVQCGHTGEHRTPVPV